MVVVSMVSLALGAALAWRPYEGGPSRLERGLIWILDRIEALADRINFKG